ncbi:MAG: restriction endonuclease subunit M [Bacteroidetes bacterium]|nr:MAG: restriction endonuclease subunit M [Bacteroidota bacterium]
MIQAVADDDERGSLGMHYTSVPNILKVLNPLFLDDLRSQLKEAGNNSRKLLNLRKRIARIRVFDPACGSGNFLVIAYKQLREIENEINLRRGETNLPTEIPLTNFRGIEIKGFSAEIARLALIIAEYQCDVLYLGHQLALAEFLPLDAENWITTGNALRVNWLSVCPPVDTGVKIHGNDLFSTPIDQVEIDFENEGGETYICGNPPYLGSREQEKHHKADLKEVFANITNAWKALDYVSGWFLKAANYSKISNASAAFVTTNSICQGQQVPLLWPIIFKTGAKIVFAHTSFKWANLASHNAGVTVIIVGLSRNNISEKRLFSLPQDGKTVEKKTPFINAYLVSAIDVELSPSRNPIGEQHEMAKGNYPVDGGHLLLNTTEAKMLNLTTEQRKKFIRPFLGSSEIIRGFQRFCIWIEDKDASEAIGILSLKERIEGVKKMRLSSKKEATKKAAKTPHKFDEIRQTGNEAYAIAMPVHSSENREWLPVALLPRPTIIYGSAFAMFDAPLWNLSIISSKIHLVWIATVCGQLETRLRYSNTLGWNTFPIPKMTEKNKVDLTKCAEEILIARERHFPATIADLYDPEKMPEDLKRAHERNDEVLERIYIGRRFKNDTERLEKLFELYTEMTANKNAG